MKKLVIFDLGQVCVRIHVERCYEFWREKSGVIALREELFDVEAHDQFERGEILAEELWAALRKAFELEMDDAHWLEGWNSIFGEEIGDTRRTVAAMKAAGLRVVILSNTNKDHVDIWKPMYPEFMDMFDEVYVSNELGARKPEPRVYERVLELEGVAGSEAVFFDDKMENIEAARALGIEAVHFAHDSAAADWWARNG